jgi:hypothetical protein
MAMEMIFPHPRLAIDAGRVKPDYSALVATATSRQATSQTVRALLGSLGGSAGEIGMLESRIEFFAQRKSHSHSGVRGAFLPSLGQHVANGSAKFESVVNYSDSIDGNDIRLGVVKPELQVAERGTEF